MMHSTTLDPVTETIDRLESGKGPVRVLLDMHGRAESPRCLGEAWTHRCHCVLVRDDGWSLGCSRDLYEAAKQLWPRQWLAVICYANTPHRITIRFPSNDRQKNRSPA